MILKIKNIIILNLLHKIKSNTEHTIYTILKKIKVVTIKNYFVKI